MKNFIKQLVCFLKSIGCTFEWVGLALFYSDFKNHLPKIREKKVLNILANGPSLATELNTINYKEGDFCVVNRFYESEMFRIIKPKYYVIADPFFFSKKEYIKPVVEDVDWEMTLLVSYSGWKKIKKQGISFNKNIHIIPFHTISYNGFKFLKYFLYRKGLSMPEPRNVLVPSIFCGVNMGYHDILIYGADHSWTQTLCVNDDNKVCAIDKHFYDTTEVKMEPYLKWDGGYYKLHELLRDFATMFDSYHVLKDYADTENCHIVNKTKGSYIDAFERG